MKFILVALLALTATAATSKTQEQILALLQAGTKASDAIDTVFQVLNDLKQANVDAQYASDLKNETDEYVAAETIEQFTKIRNLNQKLFNGAIADREHFEQVLQETKNYLAWNEARRDEIARKIETLSDNQCYSNQLFVKSIKHNQEALEVVKLLKQDVAGYIVAGESFEFSQTQAKSVAEKLKQYSSLFQEHQIKSFLALANGQEEEEGEDGEEGEQAPRQQTLAERVLGVLENLEAELAGSLDNLKQNEIAASWELAAWISSSEAEIATLEVEHERKSVFADRTATQIQASFAQQAKAKIILQESQDALDQAQADLEAKREQYASDKAKRDEENAILDEVIIMFKKQVASWSGR